MSLAGISKILEGMPEKERKEFCERILADLARERDSTATFAAWVALVVAVVVIGFVVLTWGDNLVSPFWLGGRRW